MHPRPPSSTHTDSLVPSPTRFRSVELMEGALLLTAAAFRNERTNYRVTSNDVLQPTEQVLDGRARVDGIALGATGHVTPAWTVFANYTYLDSETRQGISDYCVANPGVGDCPVEDILKGRPLNSTPQHSGDRKCAG